MAPPLLPPSRILHPGRLSRPHPFEKGRGGCGSILACEGAVAASIEPTSLNIGEGLAVGSIGNVGSGLGEGEGCGGEMVVEEGERVSEHQL
jgi:hypothetical protein